MKHLLLCVALLLAACGDSPAPSPDLASTQDLAPAPDLLSPAPDMTAGMACDPKVSTNCIGTLLVCDAASGTCHAGKVCAGDAQCGNYKCGIMINADKVCYQSCWASGAPQDSLCTGGHTCNAAGACI